MRPSARPSKYNNIEWHVNVQQVKQPRNAEKHFLITLHCLTVNINR